MNNPDQDFQLIVEGNKAMIYSVCFMYGKTREETDDMFQEVLINLWKSLKTYRKESDIKSWIYRIALNTCISYKRKKHIKTEPLEDTSKVYQMDTSIGRQTSALHKRISRLESVDRALVLLWLEDMPYEEIGKIIGVSTKNVGVRLIRIKDKLKKMNENGDC